jgi:SpoVK/Ycf46/Vps4 family AAA+-type ATPase
VLPAATHGRLRQIVQAVRDRPTVLRQWGLERRAGGYGLRVMLAGPPGTGKTMAVGAIAAELQLDVYRVDLSQTVSKYIGETEKNLDRIFDAAVAANAVLFFDEADALFGKRSEVKDAHDKYANVETAYLLQRVESYPGIVFLATNLSRNLDSAFSRRIHFVVEFSMPDHEERARLWSGMLHGVPVQADVDLEFAARQFALSGGDIRNVVLDAAFRAARDGGAVAMRHLVAALRVQLVKSGRAPSGTEFRQYVRLLDAAD